MISIYKASSTYEADIIKSVLEDNEIECFIQGYNHRSMLGFIGAYIQLDVLVDEADEIKAKELIESIEFEEGSIPEEQEVAQEIELEIKQESPSQLRNKFMRAICFAFIFPGVGSMSFGLKEAGSWMMMGTGICLFIFLVLESSSLPLLTYMRGSSNSFSFYANFGIFILLSLILLMITDMIVVLREYKRRKRELK